MFTHLQSLKIRYNGKGYRITNNSIFHYIDAINLPICVSLNVQMGRNHEITENS